MSDLAPTHAHTAHGDLRPVRHLAEAARLAPSVHNTQPWRFELSATQLTIRADRTRQLRALDPTGRQLMVSVGCAVLNARVAAAAHLLAVDVRLFPHGIDSEVVARISIRDDAPDAAEVELAPLASVLRLRATNRRRFADEPVPDELVERLEKAALVEGARLQQIRAEDDRLAVARLSQRADLLQYRDPAYRSELRSWTTADDTRLDGVPARAVPHVGAGTNDEIPIRDFDSVGAGWLPSDTHSSHHQCLLLLGADGDRPADWVRVGEALQRIWLESTRHGYAMSPLTQVVEVPSARAALRAELRLSMQPDVLIRLGRAPSTPGTSRRHLDDLIDAGQPAAALSG